MTDHYFTFRLPEVPNNVDPCQHTVTLLRQAGMNHSDAQRLVDNELRITSVMGLKSLTELLEGRYDESGEWIEALPESKSAGAKFAALLKWDGITGDGPKALTSEEREFVLIQNLEVSIESGFFDRLATYTKNPKQLKAVSKVFRPNVNSAGVKNEGLDAKHEKTRRLIAIAAEILGATSDFIDDP